MKTDKQQLDFTGDEHWGKGGRYVVNAEGKRVPAPAVEEAAAAGESIPAAEADLRKTLKEKNRG